MNSISAGDSSVDRRKDLGVASNSSPIHRRLKKKTSTAEVATDPAQPVATFRSHAKSWLRYIQGNVVSDLGKRYINNLLATTAARVVEKDEESSDEEYKPKHFRADVGSMDLIKGTLQGIAQRDPDDGVQGFGRHAKCIHIGRSLWQTEELTTEESAQVFEPTFEATFQEEVQVYHKAAQKFIKQEEQRPDPFQGKTEPLLIYHMLSMLLA